MTKDIYLFDISRTDSAKLLHHCAELAATDADLTQNERAEIQEAIARKFGRMNAVARGKQKPRWQAA